MGCGRRQRSRRQSSGRGTGKQPGIRQLPGDPGVQGCVPARAQQRRRCECGQRDDHLIPEWLQLEAGLRGQRRLLHGAAMNMMRMTGLLALAASFALGACSGASSPTTATPGAGVSSAAANAYTGPAAATADVQAFQVSFWSNVRAQNRCGQCHNSTSPAQMPNFARSDNVNLAYVQANTVVNLANPSQSLVVIKVTGGHNCWLPDNNACGQILTTWITNWANATGAASATTVQLVAPPVQTVGQSLNFPASYTDYENTVYTLTSKYCVRCHSTTADPSVEQQPYHADPNLLIAYPAAIPKIDFTGCSPFVA